MSRPLGIALALVLYGVTLSATREDLARARTLFNDRKFDEAIQAADLARKTPDTADAGAIVMARAHLERYRQVADPADLGAAHRSIADPYQSSTASRAVSPAAGATSMADSKISAAAPKSSSRNSDPPIAIRYSARSPVPSRSTFTPPRAVRAAPKSAGSATCR